MRTFPLLLGALALGSCARLEVVEELDSFTGRPLYRGLVERTDGALLAQSEWVFWHHNGRMLARGAFRDAPFAAGGLPAITRSIPAEGREGDWTFWSAEGQMRARGSYWRGLMSGQWTCWYKNGQRCWSGSFQAGLPEGYHVRWNSAGAKVEECSYEAGQLHGDRRLWSDAGDLLCLEVYARGELIEREGCQGTPPPELSSLCPLDEELEQLLVSVQRT